MMQRTNVEIQGVVEEPVETQVARVPLRVRGRRFSINPLLVLLTLCLFAALAAPIIAILWLIWNRTPDVPNADEWSVIPLVRDFYTDKFSFADLWVPNNGHRIVIMRVFTLALVEITHYNRQAMMTVNVIIAIGTAILLYRCLRRTLTPTVPRLLIAIPCALLLFSLSQYENWMLWYTNNFFTLVFAVVLCMWACVAWPPSWRGLALAVGAAFLATLSSFPGLAVWVVFAPVLWLTGYRRVSHAAVWFASALLIGVPYLVDFPKVSATASSVPLDAVRYVIVYLGSPLSHFELGRSEQAGLLSIGLMAITVFIYWYVRRTLRPIAIWLGLAGFALACAVMAAVGRGADLGVFQAQQSRYRIFSSLWWVVLAIIAAHTVTLLVQQWNERGAVVRAATRGVVGVAAVGFVALCSTLVSVSADGFGDGNAFFAQQRANQYCVLNYASAPDSCLRFYLPFAGGEESVRTLGGILERYNLAIFSSNRQLRLSRLTPTMMYSVEEVGGKRVSLACLQAMPCVASAPIVSANVPQGLTIDVRGWAVDAAVRDTAGGVIVSVDGQTDVIAEYGAGVWPGVAELFSTPAYSRSAFIARVPTDKLSPGLHTLSIHLVTHDRTSQFTVPQEITVNVVPIKELTRRSGTTQYSVDNIQGTERSIVDLSKPIVFSRNLEISVAGWAVDETARGAARGVFLTIDGTQDIAAEYGSNRADVAKVYGVSGYTDSGYVAKIPIGSLAPGTHELKLKILAADGQSYYEPSWHITIEIQA